MFNILIYSDKSAILLNTTCNLSCSGNVELFCFTRYISIYFAVYRYDTTVNFRSNTKLDILFSISVALYCSNKRLNVNFVSLHLTALNVKFDIVNNLFIYNFINYVYLYFNQDIQNKNKIKNKNKNKIYNNKNKNISSTFVYRKYVGMMNTNILTIG